MELIKKILIKLLMLVVLLFAVNITYEHTLWKADRSKYADVLDSLNAIVDSTDILYLASSSNYFHPLSDTVGYTISGFIDKQFPDLKVNSVCKGYMHAGGFYSILQNIPKASSIKTVVVSVNMRSFGAFWLYSDSETAFSQMELMMNNDYPLTFRRLLLSLDYYDNKSLEERKQQFLQYWKRDTISITEFNFIKTTFEWDSISALSQKYKDINYVIDYDKVGFMCNIIKAFAYNLDTINNVRFKQFDKIIKLANNRNWNLIFNILPEDIDKAEIMVGKEIPYILNRNKEIFIKKYRNKNVTIIDNMELLNGGYFYETYPTEHYIPKGKEIVANKVSEVISSIYTEQEFVEKAFNIDDNIQIKTSFVICENGDILNVNNPYAKPFELKSLNVYKQSVDSVIVSFKTEANIFEKLFLVVDYYNNTNSYYWKKYNLSDFKNVKGLYSKKIKLPSVIDSNDKIKIYLWNAGANDFYFTDFKLNIRN